MGTRVHIRAVDIRFLDRARIEGIYLEDLHKDTLLYVEQLDVNLDDIFLGFKHFSFDEVKVKNAQFNVRQFQGEEDLNIQFLLDYINGPRDTTDTIRSRPPEIFFWKLDLDHVNFTYEYRDSIPDTLPGFNEDLVRVHSINAQLKRFMIVDDSLTGELRNLQCFDPNGLVVRKMDTDFIISYTMMDFAGLYLETPLSSLKGKVHFDYDSYDDLSDFIPLVQMRGRIRESSIHTRDLAFFAPELVGLDQVFSINGNFKGTVDDLSGRGVQFSTGRNTRYSGSFRMKGLPETDSTLFHFGIREFSTTASDIERIPAYPFHQSERIQVPEELKRLEKITFKGELEGLLSDFKLNGKLFSKPGDILANVSMKYLPEKAHYLYKGKFVSESLNLGEIAGLEDNKLGKAAFRLDAEGEGFDPNTMTANFFSDITTLELLGYPYQNIQAGGTVDGRLYRGQVKCADPNLKLESILEADLRGLKPSYEIQASLGMADPGALKIWQADSAMVISAELFAGFKGKNADNLEGRAEISESIIRYGNSRYRLDDLLLEASGEERNRSIALFSTILDLQMNGAFSVSQILPACIASVNKAMPQWFRLGGYPKVKEHQEFQAQLKLKDTRLLSALFVPNLRLEEGGEVQMKYNSSQEKFHIQGTIPRLFSGDLEFGRVRIDADTRDSSLGLTASAAYLNITDSLQIQHLGTVAEGNNGNGNMHVQWASKSGLSSPDSRLNLSFDFLGKSARVQVLPSLILIKDSLWQVNEGNYVLFDSLATTVENLSFSHLDEFIRIDGRISKNPDDELDIILDKFRLKNINPILLSAGIRLDGQAHGIISLAGLRKDPYFMSNLKFNGIKLNDDLLGDGQLYGKWVPSEKRIDLDGALIAGNAPRLSFKGGFYPARKENSLDIALQLNNLRVDLFESYLKDIFSNIADGYADGNIHLTGTPDAPVTEGNILLKRTALTVDLLNTTYSFTHAFRLEKDQIVAKNVHVTDQQGNTAQLNFKLSHRNYNHLRFDVSLSSERIMALNTTEYQSDLFYGTAFASGTFRAHGPIDNLVMDINARTEKGTKFYLPLYDAGEISKQDFITFEKTGLATRHIRKKKVLGNSKGYELNFNLNISNDADVVLIFDPQTGDMIQGKGTADLHMEFTETGTFNMYGDYTISSGNYQFNMVVSKPFDLEPGGVISFKGDPYDADINITALYKVRTSLYNLVKNIDSSATVKRTIDVQAAMHLTDKLMRPQVRFDILLPNADESTRNLLRSQIASDDELNRQVFALIMLGSFWPNQGGASEIAGMGGANASELISSQLSSMLGRLSDDLKLGVNYKQGDAAKTEELRLIWSTQLLGDRVMIDGNFGTAGIPQSAVQNTSNLVGEFTIEAKLNEDGTIRIKVFNRSNQYLLVYNGVPYTQGVGLFYRRDFDMFSDLKRKKK